MAGAGAGRQELKLISLIVALRGWFYGLDPEYSKTDLCTQHTKTNDGASWHFPFNIFPILQSSHGFHLVPLAKRRFLN